MSRAYVALLRGINVGKAKRVAMEDLRSVATDLGLTNPKTLLNSGNLLFNSPKALPAAAPDNLRKAIAKKTGVSANVIIVSAGEVDQMIDECPMEVEALDPRKLLVGVTEASPDANKIKGLASADWSPEEIAIGKRWVYLWSPRGVIESPLWNAAMKELGESVTTRNWATMLKIQTALASLGD